MPIAYRDAVAVFEGLCEVHEAEELTVWLEGDAEDGGGRTADLSALQHMHAAVLQALMARPPARLLPPVAEKPAAWARAVFGPAAAPTDTP